ncbi:MAG: acyltransferase [Muribaculaceae bacterium]|nr:acyltransferase [Muribaculaceae bacterium]
MYFKKWQKKLLLSGRDNSKFCPGSDCCLIVHNVVFATLNHDMNPDRRQICIPKSIELGKNVWIGSNSTILSEVKIGHNAIVAAGAVVHKDVEANSIVGGVPAKFIKWIV